MHLQAALLASLLLLTRAAEEAESSDSCFIKSGDPSYSYNPLSSDGPSLWGTLTPDFEACSAGTAQSPIDFPTKVSYAPLADGPKPALGRPVLELSSGSYNWGLNCPADADCGSTEFGGKVFKLVNLHFHAPSEHTLNGKQFPLEAHMVHQSDDGLFAVLATMFEAVDTGSYQSKVYAGDRQPFGESPLMGSIIRNFRKDRTAFSVPLGGVINARKGYCVYVGSFTTPPCTEEPGVTFLMSNNVKTVTKRQVSDYLLSSGASSVDGNNRPVQDRNDREVTCYISQPTE